MQGLQASNRPKEENTKVLEEDLATTSASVPSSNLQAAFNTGAIKELNKKVHSIPEGAKLKGPENYDQWKQALSIQFRALGLPEFIDNPSLAGHLADCD